jgi:hypothetical protein
MRHEHVELFEGALIEKQFDTLARRQLAASVLRLNALYAAAQSRRGATMFETFDNVFHKPALSFW